MSTKPNSISELIARWPTIAEFATEVGCGYEAARKMATRGRVGPRHWGSVVEVCERRGIPGVSIEWLAAQYGPSKPVEAAPAVPALQTENAA